MYHAYSTRRESVFEKKNIDDFLMPCEVNYNTCLLLLSINLFPTEHRNMPLDDAMPFLSRNFDNFVELMKQKISQANEWVAPDSKVAFYLNLLAEGRRVTLAEIVEVDKYLQVVINKLRRPSVTANRLQTPVSGSRETLMEPPRQLESRGLMGLVQRGGQPHPRQGEERSGS